MPSFTCDVACVGQAVIDCIARDVTGNPSRDRVCHAREIGISTGGDALNESSVLAKLGCSVRLVCGLGLDTAGNFIMGEATRRGIDTSQVTRADWLGTPVTQLLLREDPDRSTVNSEASKLLGYVPSPDAIAGARVVTLASLFRAPFDAPEKVLPLARRAKEQGSILVADTKKPNYDGMQPSELAELWPLLDWIFPNEGEAALYTGKESPLEAAAELRKMGVRNVVVKCGPDGVVVNCQEGTFSLPARKVTVVDTTGAGDNFVAGFVTGLLDGCDARECCERGIAQASETVQHVGATQD